MKKIRDLTIDTLVKTCMSNDCDTCPLRHLGCQDNLPRGFFTNELNKEVNNDDLLMKDRTLNNMLLHQTEVNHFCIIYDSGWEIASCYIDDEDLFIKHMDADLLGRRVKTMQLVEDERFKDKVYKIDLH